MSEPTARQIEVLEAFRRHGSRKMAAAELGITDETAKVHLRRLRRRLRALGCRETDFVGVIPQDRASDR
jgi:DNA-binding CsgD family transcriptional regulator